MKDKLVEIKNKIIILGEKYPELLEKNDVLEDYNNQVKLMKEFNDILKKTDYKCANDNLIKIPKKEISEINLDEISDEQLKKKVETNQKYLLNLPKNCGITSNMVPSDCYYLADNGTKGDAFGICLGNPLSDGKKWITSRNRKISLNEKLILLKNKLKQLRRN